MRIALAAVATILMGTAAWAQPVPSTDDVISALKPRLGAPTRGIRPVGPATAPAAAPGSPMTPPRTGAATADAGAASMSMQVQFVSGSDQLTPQARRVLDSLGQALVSSDLKAFRFRVEGHTDTVGSREANEALSARRAAAVIGYVTTKYGVERARLEAVGLGPSQLLVPTGPGVPEARNRRVQVVNLGT